MTDNKNISNDRHYDSKEPVTKQKSILHLASCAVDNLTHARFIMHNGKQYNIDELISLADRAEKLEQALDVAIEQFKRLENETIPIGCAVLRSACETARTRITEILEKE